MRDEFSLTICESQLKLIRYQSSLEEKLKNNFCDLTLHDTLIKLLEINELKLADKLHSEFKVPERRLIFDLELITTIYFYYLILT